MTNAPSCTVIIPAFNEERVIGRCLERMQADAPDDNRMDIVVAANGCVDATVEVAKAAAPRARILDLPSGSKTKAINAALEITSQYPVIVIDADVECSYNTILALAEALRDPNVMTASPAIRLNLENCDWMIRAYFRVWLEQPYANSGNGGAGCYGLSLTAAKEIGRFPDIVGDDVWVHTRFPASKRRRVTKDSAGEPVFSTVHPPRSAIGQIRVEARRQIGNAEVLRRFPSNHTIRSGGHGAVRAALRSGSHPLDVFIHFGMKLCSRLLAKWLVFRGRDQNWTRDLSSRQVHP